MPQATPAERDNPMHCRDPQKSAGCGRANEGLALIELIDNRGSIDFTNGCQDGCATHGWSSRFSPILSSIARDQRGSIN